MLFGTDGIRFSLSQDLAKPCNLIKIAFSISKSLNAGDICMVRDTRASGFYISRLLSAVFSYSGTNVYDFSILPSSAASFFALRTKSFGIAITASHNDKSFNGIKIFNPCGEKISKEEESKIERYFAKNPELESANKFGFLHKKSASDYVKFLLKNAPKKKIESVTVNCSNGASYLIAQKIFRKVAKNVNFLGVTPNGYNINESFACNDEFCLKFDGDADRMQVFSYSREIEAEYIIALFSLFFRRISNKVVLSEPCNLALEEWLKENGFKVYRAPVGDRNIYEVMKKSNAAFAAENSGHYIFKRLLPVSDSIISALTLFKALKSNIDLETIREELHLNFQAKLNVDVKEKVDFKLLPSFLRAIEYAKDSLPRGSRVIVRYSGTEPLLRILVECKERKLAEDAANFIAESYKGALNELEN